MAHRKNRTAALQARLVNDSYAGGGNKMSSRCNLSAGGQGSQFADAAFTGVLADNGIVVSMDGKGAWRDKVFVERLWRSVKYEEVYLRAYESVG